MLVFIVPLKSPKIARSKARLFQLLERCLRSICRQTDPNFAVALVCNEAPEIPFSHPCLHMCVVDLPIPRHSFEEKEQDKARKIIAGIDYARRSSPSHVMVVDADDCISNRIAAFVNRNADKPGWILTKGYVCRDGGRLAFLNVKNFNQSCGSSIIVRTDLFANLISRELIYDHNSLRLPAGVVLQPLPFCGAVYVIGNGENIFMDSARLGMLRRKEAGPIYYLRKALKYRPQPVTPSFREQFGFYVLAKPGSAMLTRKETQASPFTRAAGTPHS